MTYTLYKYRISADQGKTWTEQFLTEGEAANYADTFPDWIIEPVDPRLCFKKIYV